MLKNQTSVTRIEKNLCADALSYGAVPGRRTCMSCLSKVLSSLTEDRQGPATRSTEAWGHPVQLSFNIVRFGRTRTSLLRIGDALLDIVRVEDKERCTEGTLADLIGSGRRLQGTVIGFGLLAPLTPGSDSGEATDPLHLLSANEAFEDWANGLLSQLAVCVFKYIDNSSLVRVQWNVGVSRAICVALRLAALRLMPKGLKSICWFARCTSSL